MFKKKSKNPAGDSSKKMKTYLASADLTFDAEKHKEARAKAAMIRQ
jgi:hypothetical protein